MKKTLLFDFHKNHSHLSHYAGFQMPLWFSSSVKEHLAVRNSVGVFDVSHMGRLLICGSESLRLLNHLLTNDPSSLNIMKGQHAFFCNSSGGVIDDVMVFRLSRDKFLIVTNAGNLQKDFIWIRENLNDLDVEIEDLTENVPMITVQGPRSVHTVSRIFGPEVTDMSRLHCAWFFTGINRFLVSRTGYTGEDGFEIYIVKHDGREDVLRFWEMILDTGKSFGIEPCGLAARDTLRIEAGFCLYGNELSEETTPIEAGLKFGVKFDQRDFIGKEALSKKLRERGDKIRIGLELVDRGIPRKGMKIKSDNKEIGVVTSGTFSPILKAGIAIGYVPPDFASPGTEVEIDIRGKGVRAKVVKFPFYNEDKYGWKRKQSG
jgi:aminomethyltransferase